MAGIELEPLPGLLPGLDVEGFETHFEEGSRTVVAKIDGTVVMGGANVPAALLERLRAAGREFPTAGPSYPKGMRKRLRGRWCFDNASRTSATYGLQYAEGFALSQMGVWIHHAWNLDEHGSVLDRTWEERGTRYYGVVIPDLLEWWDSTLVR